MDKILTNAEILEYFRQNHPGVEVHITEDEVEAGSNDYCLYSGDATAENIEAVYQTWLEALKRYKQRVALMPGKETGTLASRGVAVPWVKFNEKGVSNWATWYPITFHNNFVEGRKKDSVYTIRRRRG